MNKYLPTREELQPITNPFSTFYACGFNEDFDKLDFKKQLEVVNDLIRQTMISDEKPELSNEIDSLVGNCHTAALATIDYLKYLNIGYNHRLVICRGRPYDPEDIVSRHTAVLVDDEKGNTYFVDSTPYVGYMFGKVVNCNEQKVYREFFVLEGEKFELFTQMREIIHKGSTNTLKKEDVYKNAICLAKSLKYPFLNGHISQCLFYLSKLVDNQKIKQIMLKKSIELDPYESLAGRYIQESLNRKNMIFDQVKNWQTQLAESQNKTERSPQQEFELARYVFQEKKLQDDSMETRVDIGNKPNRISNFTPRMFLENGLNIVMLKPSAFKAKVDEQIKKEIINDESEIIYSYSANLGQARCLTGLHPMFLAHPVGIIYERAMYGPSEILVVKHSAIDLHNRKKELRKNLATEFYNKSIDWYDGEKITWEPQMLNLVHTTDEPCEACLHFNISQPEQQLMTRFMYPNPIFEKVESKLYEKFGDKKLTYNERLAEINNILEEIHPTVNKNEQYLTR